MENEKMEKKGGNQTMLKICGFIVDKRNLFFLLFGILIIFSAVSRNWVNVENSMSHYLPDSTETKQGLDLMEQEFITYGTCDVMVANVSYEGVCRTCFGILYGCVKHCEGTGPAGCL